MNSFIFSLFIFFGMMSSGFAGGMLPTAVWSQKNSMKVKQVVGGQNHTCVLLDNSAVKCWGGNATGQLGTGSTANLGDGTGEMGDSLPSVNLGTNRTAVQIVAGGSHTCALLDNSTVKCWGYNLRGQLGQGHTNNIGEAPGQMGDSLPAVDLGTGRTARQIAAGNNHTCALLDNYTVKCWGLNSMGHLGQGHANNIGDGAGEMGDALPAVNLGTGRTALQIATGSDHTCAILDNSTVKCWGYNNNGQLGQGSTGSIGASAGSMGDALPAINLGTGRTALQVAAGNNHTCAILDNFSVKCWGNNSNGNLGIGNVTVMGDGAGEMGDALPAADLGTNRKAMQISVGGNHTCALLDNSTVKCWGYNGNGRLGLGHTNTLGDGAGEMGDALSVVDLGTGRTALQVSAGINHTCALLDNSTVKCWGFNGWGQLGQSNMNYLGDGPGEMGDALTAIKLGTSSSRLAKILDQPLIRTKRFKQIAVGDYFACALLDNSSVKCWGQNSQGQLGLGNMTGLGDSVGEMGDSLPSIDLGTGRKVLQISSGVAYACALLDNSTVKCWGNNSYGKLGQGHANSLGDGAGEMGDSLSAISLGTGRTAVQIATGSYHTCAILDNSSVKCWGLGSYGVLGQGNTTTLGDNAGEMGDSLPAVSLGAGRTVVQISLGSQHTCALLDNSTIKCWGNNASGQLGQGNTSVLGDGAGEMGDSLPAVNLGTGRTALQVAAGYYHTCALLDDSTVKCWGSNTYGQLGQGNTNVLGDEAGEMGDSLPAIDLGVGRKAKQISAGAEHTCALLDNGTVKCWGRNLYGNLGQGNTNSIGDGVGEMGDSLAAINLGTGRTIVQISAYAYQTCAVLDNSTMKCWGSNTFGQLGQGHVNNVGDGAGEMGDALPAVALGTSK
ncbi:RCC1 domain-containing protein [Bdellovibrio sp. HCB-162]|uniref:RCC1 domain-containing protein n=1 Tax=Bdellovibrio sp. HCB-162 TaxID=3394234 RepID=UPI0039BCF5FA